MALYNCTECNKPVSELANSCPHCGALGSGHRSREYARKGRRSNRVLLVIVVIVSVLAYIATRPKPYDYDVEYSAPEQVSEQSSSTLDQSSTNGEVASDQTEGNESDTGMISTSSGFYTCCYATYLESADAEAAAAELREGGYAADKLWIPDYRSLSGVQQWLVYIGNHPRRIGCETELSLLRESLSQDIYGAYVSVDGEKDYIQ